MKGGQSLEQYLDLVKHTLKNGVEKKDRTGTGTISIFGYQMRYDLTKGFPLVTTKEVPFRLVASELLWFLKGYTNIRQLLMMNNHIWDEWGFDIWVNSEEYKKLNLPDMTDFGKRRLVDFEFAKDYDLLMKFYRKQILEDDEFAEKFGDLGSIYGKQWRSWGYYDKDEQGSFCYREFDQIKEVIKEIQENPNSRRLIVNAWNVGDYRSNKMKLPPCHILFQFNVTNGKLNCHLFQRSCDIFLGCPFNIASYSLLTHMIAQVCDLGVGEFIHSIGDGHIYKNHIPQMLTQINRKPKPLPILTLDKSVKNIEEFTLDHIQLSNYHPCSPLKGAVSV